MNMDNIWHLGVIRYLQKTGLGPKEIHVDMDIDRIHKMVMDDRRLTVIHIANAISISRE